MAEVIWSPSALDDVDTIAEYIARDSRDQAALVVGRLIEATGQLTSFPLSGRMIPEIGESDCREVIVGVYRVMYRIVDEQVWIVGVVHGARNWRPG